MLIWVELFGGGFATIVWLSSRMLCSYPCVSFPGGCFAAIGLANVLPPRSLDSSSPDALPSRLLASSLADALSLLLR
jgi:hypothetical protein